MFNLGVNTNNECGDNLKQILLNIKEAGFTDIMVAAKVGNLEQTLKQAKELGLNICFLHLTNSNNLWAQGEENKKYVADIKKQLQLCKEYKIKIAVLHATKGQANELALPPNQHGLDCVNEIVAYAKKCGVKIALENLDKPNFKHFEYIMQNITSPNLGFCYDVGHHQLYNPNVDILKKYSDRILAVHLHDNFKDWQYGYDWTRDLHLLPMDGKIDYNKICKNLAKTKYKNTIMLEVHKQGADEIYNETNLQQRYGKLTALQFLKQAYLRAEKIAEMIETERKTLKK